MSKQQQFLVMLVGKTHAGKTTFGRRLNRWLPYNILLEGDDINVFLAQRLPELYFQRFIADYGHNHPKVKFKIYFTILKFALSCGRNVTLTFNNVRRQWRARILNMARRCGAKTIMVFLDLPDRILIQRIRRTKRPLNYYFEDKNFEDILLLKHNRWLERPTPYEANYFLVVHKASDLPHIEQRLRHIIRNLGYAV